MGAVEHTYLCCYGVQRHLQDPVRARRWARALWSPAADICTGPSRVKLRRHNFARFFLSENLIGCAWTARCGPTRPSVGVVLQNAQVGYRIRHAEAIAAPNAPRRERVEFLTLDFGDAQLR